MPGDAHPDAKRRRDGLHGLIVIAATVILSFLTAELAVRCLGTDPQRWDLRNFAAYPLSPQQRWSFLQPDGRLGWVPRGGYSGPDFGGLHLTFDLQGLRAHRTAPAHGLDQRPLLAVGNSYTMGAEVADDETYPAHLESELGRVVHNGGVLGYGLDQTILRAEQLVPALAPEAMVVGFIADDVRRAGMKVLWGQPKPYFEIAGGELALRNVPVPPPNDMTLDPLRAVLGYSRGADVLFRRLRLQSWWIHGQGQHAEAAHDQAEGVACRLMERLRWLGGAHGVRVLLLAQYSQEAWHSPAALSAERRTNSSILACARDQGLEALDTVKAIERAVRQAGLEMYYVGSHMSDGGNRLTAKLIAERLADVADPASRTD